MMLVAFLCCGGMLLCFYGDMEEYFWDIWWKYCWDNYSFKYYLYIFIEFYFIEK